jgi:hypothetical protein
MRMARQGDVLLLAIAALPAEPLLEVAREEGRVVLAHGELTGHAHAFEEADATLLRREGSEDLFLRLDRECALRYEEHAPIVVPGGLYRVVRQREYRPGGVIPVGD